MQAFYKAQASEEVVHEKVKKVTQGHEIVDIGGFIIKRRKVQNVENLPRNEPTNPGYNAHSMKTPARMPADDFSQYPNRDGVDEVYVDQHLYSLLVQNMNMLPPTAQPADRLAVVCNSVGGSEAANCGNAVLAGALQDVFASFDRNMKEAIQSGAIQLAEPGRDGAGDADLHIDLEARKTALRARLAKFQQEEAEWHALLNKINQLECQDPTEETEAKEQGGEVVESSELCALRMLNQSIHRRLATQVDGVCLLVGDVEELVSQANRSAQIMQADYHQEKFKTFPHVNSPAHLIKAIIKGPH